MKIVLLLLLVCGCSVKGQVTTNSTNHYEVLKRETVFGIAGGFSGAVTPAGHSLIAITKQKDAVALFTKLTQEDSAATRLYGLLGLKTTSPDEFKNALPAFLANKSQVAVLEGCIQGNRDIASVAKEIAMGRWDASLQRKDLKARRHLPIATRLLLTVRQCLQFITFV